MEMNEQEMMAVLAELEAILDGWKAESSDPHTLIACEEAVYFVRHAYQSIAEIA